MARFMSVGELDQPIKIQDVTNVTKTLYFKKFALKKSTVADIKGNQFVKLGTAYNNFHFIVCY